MLGLASPAVADTRFYTDGTVCGSLPELDIVGSTNVTASCAISGTKAVITLTAAATDVTAAYSWTGTHAWSQDTITAFHAGNFLLKTSGIVLVPTESSDHLDIVISGNTTSRIYYHLPQPEKLAGTAVIIRDVTTYITHTVVGCKIDRSNLYTTDVDAQTHSDIELDTDDTASPTTSRSIGNLPHTLATGEKLMLMLEYTCDASGVAKIWGGTVTWDTLN